MESNEIESKQLMKDAWQVKFELESLFGFRRWECLSVLHIGLVYSGQSRSWWATRKANLNFMGFCSDNLSPTAITVSPRLNSTGFQISWFFGNRNEFNVHFCRQTLESGRKCMFWKIWAKQPRNYYILVQIDFRSEKYLQQHCWWALQERCGVVV